MGLNILRTTANVSGGSTYTPVATLLSGTFWVLTLGAGAITIAPAVGLTPGDIIAIKVILPNVGVCALTWAPEYQLYGNFNEYSGGGAVTYGFFVEGGAFQRIWTGGS